MLPDVGGCSDCAWGRTRTGMGLPPRDFRTTTAFAAARPRVHLWSGLYLCHTARRHGPHGSGRGRQVSTLSRAAAEDAGPPGLSSVLQPPRRAAGPPNLTPFTPAVSEPGAQFSQVPCVYQFRHPGVGLRRDSTRVPAPPLHAIQACQSSGKSGCTIGAPSASCAARPGKSGEVGQGRGAWRMSSPSRRSENTRRRVLPLTPAEACKVSM